MCVLSPQLSVCVYSVCLTCFPAEPEKETNDPHHRDRRASTTRRSPDEWMDTKKKSQNKLRLTSLRLGTIASCVWKLIGSATASFHRAEWKGLFVATGRTKGKQSHLLSAVWVCPSEAAWLCTSIYWGSFTAPACPLLVSLLLNRLSTAWWNEIMRIISNSYVTWTECNLTAAAI